jgi:hypothetical protein
MKMPEIFIDQFEYSRELEWDADVDTYPPMVFYTGIQVDRAETENPGGAIFRAEFELLPYGKVLLCWEELGYQSEDGTTVPDDQRIASVYTNVLPSSRYVFNRLTAPAAPGVNWGEVSTKKRVFAWYMRLQTILVPLWVLAAPRRPLFYTRNFDQVVKIVSDCWEHREGLPYRQLESKTPICDWVDHTAAM